MLRRFLKMYREAGKIDKHVYHDMYVKVKGNVFRNKRALMEAVHELKREKGGGEILFEQFDAKVRRERKKFLGL